MTPYSRPQLWVLFAIAALGGIGVGVGHWRRTHADLAERIEGFDLAPVESAPSAVAPIPPRDRSARRPAPAPVTPRGDRDTSAHAERPRAGRSRPRKRQLDEGPLDLNRATIDELARLPGLGPGLARRIVSARERGGFDSLDDLTGVPGLGPAKLARLRGLVNVSR